VGGFLPLLELYQKSPPPPFAFRGRFCVLSDGSDPFFFSLDDGRFSGNFFFFSPCSARSPFLWQGKATFFSPLWAFHRERGSLPLGGGGFSVMGGCPPSIFFSPPFQVPGDEVSFSGAFFFFLFGFSLCHQTPVFCLPPSPLFGHIPGALFFSRLVLLLATAVVFLTHGCLLGINSCFFAQFK